MKRYSPNYGEIEIDEEGDLCSFDDYQDLQKQLEEMTKERDHYKRLVELSDALRNAERGYGINPLFNANQGK